MNEQPVTETLSAEEWTAERLRAWAGCVRRLMAVAPTRAVKAETGVTGGHSTPPERAAIREAALRVVDQWLERDVLDAARAGEGLEDTRLLARCLGNFTIGQFDDLPPEARAAWIENAVDVQRAVRQYRAASPTSEEK